DDPHQALKDKGIVDSGCSKHMIGNKGHLVDYQEFKGGYVAFRCSNGRITDTNGMIKVLPPKTAEEVVARERERKARTTLLMALLEDHLAKFHKMADAKEIWEAIKSRFSGNNESKKMQKYLLKQQFKGLDTLSFDDLYNNLRVFKRDVKVSKSQKEGSASYTDEVIHPFFSNQFSAPQLDCDDLEHINDDDLEGMDLKWQTAELNRIKTVEEEMVGTMATKLETIAEDLHLRMILKLWLPYMERLLIGLDILKKTLRTLL
nr:xylulose kinase-1 [Tanacetum cinerariifolium]